MANLKLNNVTAITETSGAITAKNDHIHTVSNNYKYITHTELNSLGLLRHNFFGATYTLTTNISPSGSTWTQLTSWRKMNSTGTTGASDADPFAKLTSNEWTPGVAGYYFVHLSICSNAGDNEAIYAQVRRSIDGGTTSEDSEGNVLSEISAGQSPTYQTVSCTGILPLDTNDSLEFWGKIDSNSKIFYKSASVGRQTSICVSYLGSSSI